MLAPDSDRIVQFIRDPSLQHIELRYSQYSQPVFRRHNHDAYSIGLVKKGSTRFHLVQQSEAAIPVSRGDIVLINPGDVHACNPESGSLFSYFMLYMQPEYFSILASDFYGEPISGYRFPIPVLKDKSASRLLDDVCRLMLAGDTRLVIETGVHETLAAILNACGSQNNLPPVKTGNVQAGYEFLQAHLAENISLQELASLCNLSPYHFLRSFRRLYGLPPHAIQLQMRINTARRLLAAGQSIADAAASVGFSDQSHFTRNFRVAVGATPLQYQSSIRPKAER